MYRLYNIPHYTGTGEEDWGPKFAVTISARDLAFKLPVSKIGLSA